jgi:hypothetical protein
MTGDQKDCIRTGMTKHNALRYIDKLYRDS